MARCSASGGYQAFPAHALQVRFPPIIGSSLLANQRRSDEDGQYCFAGAMIAMPPK
jgi:hypothetical protein